MNDTTTTREKRILKIAAITGLVIAALCYLLLRFGFPGAVMTGLIVGLIVAVILWLTGQKDDVAATHAMAATPAAAPAAAEVAAPVASPVAADPAPVTADDAGQGGDTEMPAPAAENPSVLKPSARLAGQEELASRKGSWKYEGTSAVEAMPDADAAPIAHPDATGASEAQALPDAEAPAGPAIKPAMLSAPRSGGADNLKQIKGVGPKLEALLHEMGVYHFDQIAGWTETEVAWMDQNLKGFKGRVSRDTWIEQAQVLAAGGETAFSSKVGKGGVY
ncbi:endonuclease [Loktanella sp. R86503]|uniref:endonuclease n=1 Tax=Loktanella sp. R86503 TaxID=3093847 RepID=UPI0036D7B686